MVDDSTDNLLVIIGQYRIPKNFAVRAHSADRDFKKGRIGIRKKRVGSKFCGPRKTVVLIVWTDLLDYRLDLLHCTYWYFVHPRDISD